MQRKHQLINLLCLFAIFLLFVTPPLSACSQTASDSSYTNESGGKDFVQIMLSLYKAPERLTRIQAMLYSIGIAPRGEILQALEGIANKTDDNLERTVVYYVLASSTMKSEHIDAFLDAFLNDQQVIRDLCDCENILTYALCVRLNRFLFKISKIEKHSVKAKISIVALAYYLAEYGEIPSSWYDDDSYKEIIDKGSRYHKSSLNMIDFESFDRLAIVNQLLHLAKSEDIESRMTFYLFQRNFVNHSDYEFTISMCNTMHSELNSKVISSEEQSLLMFSIATTCDFLPGYRVPWFEDFMYDYANLLPIKKEDIENILTLEKSTYKVFGYGERMLPKDNILSSIMQEAYNNENNKNIFRVKLLAYLQYGKEYINEIDFVFFETKAKGE